MVLVLVLVSSLPRAGFILALPALLVLPQSMQSKKSMQSPQSPQSPRNRNQFATETALCGGLTFSPRLKQR